MTEQWSLIRFFEMGGVFMWPLLVFSILTVGLILERVLYLLIHDLRAERVRRELMPYIEDGHIRQAEEFLNGLKPRNVSGRILREIMKNAPYGNTGWRRLWRRKGRSRSAAWKTASTFSRLWLPSLPDGIPGNCFGYDRCFPLHCRGGGCKRSAGSQWDI